MAQSTHVPPTIKWHRCTVGREEMRELSKRSDLKGFIQATGHLLWLMVTGAAAWYSAGRTPWPVTVLLLLLHGTGWAFLENGFHELIHNSVFQTRRLNVFFLRIVSFLSWHNHHMFWASHTEHHKFTLHQPDDLEVVLPAPVTLRSMLMASFINPHGFYQTLKQTTRLAFGRLEGEWEHALFDHAKPEERRALFNWARILLAGHGAIVLASVLTGQWMLAVVVSLAQFYGAGLQIFCNLAQHTGLQDRVPDFRLCCRTITLHPVLEFLYWHMNYHTEHHMFAAVPCYNLAKLHRLIRDQMPPCHHGLWSTWREIFAVIRRQQQEPGYQFIAQLPDGPRQENAPAANPEATEAA